MSLSAHEVKPLERDLIRFTSSIVSSIEHCVVTVVGIGREKHSKVGIEPEHEVDSGTKHDSAHEMPRAIVNHAHMSEFEKRREDLSQESSEVAVALTGAFSDLKRLVQQQGEMASILANLDDRLTKRRSKVPS